MNKKTIRRTLLAALLLFVCYSVSTLFTFGKQTYKEGDIVFQMSKSRQSPLIQLATASPWSHCGIIIEKSDGLYVLEAAGHVKLTPLSAWIKRGRWGTVKRKRVFDRDIKIKYKKYLGQPYDLAFKFDFTEPDTTDTSVLLYSRSADLTADGKPLGSLVVDGKLFAKTVCASVIALWQMAEWSSVWHVATKCAPIAKLRGGDFFRQFVLVSNGVLPGTFLLHGKVERRALGRMADDTYYYIETRHRETLWDFADALREYGFVDAIYITGGATPTWYRSPDGARHPLGSYVETSSAHLQGKVPWLVFRKR